MCLRHIHSRLGCLDSVPDMIDAFGWLLKKFSFAVQEIFCGRNSNKVCW